MNKEEILEKSRRENNNKDIAELEVINRASGIACRTGLAVCCMISVLEVIFTSDISFSSWAIYYSMLGTLVLVKYIKLRRRHELAAAILFLTIGAAFLVGYIVKLRGGL